MNVENGAKKSVFKSPTSSTLVTSSTLNHLGNNAAVSKVAVLLNCSNNYPSQSHSNSQRAVGPARIPQSRSHQSGLNLANKNNLAGPKPLGNNNNNLVQLNATKRKTTGYCECCKQRYDNLKQV